MRKRPAPHDPPRALGMVLLQGPWEGHFLVSEVPPVVESRNLEVKVPDPEVRVHVESHNLWWGAPTP